MKFSLLLILLLIVLSKTTTSYSIIYVDNTSINSTIKNDCGSSIYYPCRNLQSTVPNIENLTTILISNGKYYYDDITFNENQNNIEFITIRSINNDSSCVIFQGYDQMKPFFQIFNKHLKINIESISFENFNKFPLLFGKVTQYVHSTTNNNLITFKNCNFKDTSLNSTLFNIESLNLNIQQCNFNQINLITKSNLIRVEYANINICSSTFENIISNSSIISSSYSNIVISDSSFNNTDSGGDGLIFLLNSNFNIQNSNFSFHNTSSSIYYTNLVTPQTSFTLFNNKLISNCIFGSNKNNNTILMQQQIIDNLQNVSFPMIYDLKSINIQTKMSTTTPINNHFIINCIFDNNQLDKPNRLNGIINLKSNLIENINIDNTIFKNNIGNSINSENVKLLTISNSRFTQFLNKIGNRGNSGGNGKIQSTHLNSINNTLIIIDNVEFQDSFTLQSYSLKSNNTNNITIINNSKFISTSPINCVSSNIQIGYSTILNQDRVVCSLNKYTYNDKICNVSYLNDNQSSICPTNLQSLIYPSFSIGMHKIIIFLMFFLLIIIFTFQSKF